LPIPRSIHFLVIDMTHTLTTPTTPAHEVNAPFHLEWLDYQRQTPKPVKISVIIPTLNEAKNLPHVLPRIPSWVHEVIIVDGRSKDGTPEVARRLMPDVRIVEEKKRGKGAALLAGFHAATGDIIVMLDADGSMDPKEMATYVAALCSGADFVKGSRYLQGGGSADLTPVRDLGNWGLTMVVKVLFGCRYSDLCYGYCGFWRHVLPALDLKSDGFEIETEMNVRALVSKLRIVEVSSYEAQRIHGESHLRPVQDGLRVLRTIMRERLRAWSQPAKEPAPAQQTNSLSDQLTEHA
jgi:glycosyltransferase involved in cell wall biosynthesis